MHIVVFTIRRNITWLVSAACWETNAQRIVVVKLEKCRALGRSDHGCKHNGQMGVYLVSCNDVD